MRGGITDLACHIRQRDDFFSFIILLLVCKVCSESGSVMLRQDLPETEVTGVTSVAEKANCKIISRYFLPA